MLIELDHKNNTILVNYCKKFLGVHNRGLKHLESEAINERNKNDNDLVRFVGSRHVYKVIDKQIFMIILLYIEITYKILNEY